MPSDPTALLREGDRLFDQSKYDEAAATFRDAAAAAERAGDVSTRVEALSVLARCYLIRDRNAEGRPYIEQAGQLASPEHPKGWSRYLGVRGRFEWRDDKNLPAATRTFKAMFDYCMAHGLHNRAVDAAHMVAITGGDDEQIPWAMKGIEAANASGDEGWLGPLWNNLGWTYSARGQHDNALDALLKAREYHHRHSGPLPRLAADVFVGQAYRLAGQPDEARRWIDAANARAKEMLAEKPDDGGIKERLGNTHEQLGELDAARGATTTTVANLEQARALYVEAGAEQWGPEELARVDQRLKQLRGEVSR